MLLYYVQHLIILSSIYAQLQHVQQGVQHLGEMHF